MENAGKCTLYKQMFPKKIQQPRTGNIVVAYTGEKDPLLVCLVMTLWPKMQKPKPCAASVPLTNIKCFRAVVLEQTDEGLKPTTTLSMLDGINVLAILDSEGSDLNRGNLVISQESQELLSKLKAGEFEKPTLPKRKRRCPTTKAARKRVAKKVKQMHAKKNSKNSRTDQEPTAQDKKRSRTESALEHAESITSADLRKNAAGRTAISNVMARCRELDCLKFENPVFHSMTNLCTLPGLEHMTFKVFSTKASKYFECKYAFSARSPADYGERVFADLVLMCKNLRKDPPSRKQWIALVKDVAKTLDVSSLV